MATVTATITVDFTANYAGPHRVCFRIQGSGDPYDCSTVVNCVGGGTACQAIINTPVNTTSCDGTVVFEGYIQAECEDILSTNGRLVWTANFVPNVVCQRTELLCARGDIDTVIGNPAGQEYLLADTLAIVRNGSDTETLDGTISIASVGDGIINTISALAAAGTGYVAAEVLTIVDGGATGAGATITIDTVGGSGEITGYTLTTNGTDYIGPFTFTGGSGAGADFTITDGVDYDVFGSITGVTISVGGLYGITPTVVITTGTGSGAILEVGLDACPEIVNIGTDCNSDLLTIPAGMNVGESFALCLDGGITGVVPSQFETSESGCCIPADTVTPPCRDFHIENLSGGLVNVAVTRCEGDVDVIAVADSTDITVCAIINGVFDPNIVGLTVTDTGSSCIVS